jgi:hypothetical protein
MQTIHYGKSEFDTADAIARAVLGYAEILTARRHFAVIDIPTATPAGVVTAHLLIGPGIPLASVTSHHHDDAAVGATVPRDEFGGTPAAEDSGIGELEIHRAVRSLLEGAARVRASAPAAVAEDPLEDAAARRENEVG